MARRKKKNIIDVAAARSFIYEVYGLKTAIVNEYELMVIHTEFMGIFHWYHTTGKLVVRLKDEHGVDQIGLPYKCLTDEELAITITEYVYRLLADGKYYKQPREKHSPTAITERIMGPSSLSIET